MARTSLCGLDSTSANSVSAVRKDSRPVKGGGRSARTHAHTRVCTHHLPKLCSSGSHWVLDVLPSLLIARCTCTITADDTNECLNACLNEPSCKKAWGYGNWLVRLGRSGHHDASQNIITLAPSHIHTVELKRYDAMQAHRHKYTCTHLKSLLAWTAGSPGQAASPNALPLPVHMHSETQ